MNWKQFKAAVEACGVSDYDPIAIDFPIPVETTELSIYTVDQIVFIDAVDDEDDEDEKPTVITH